MKVCVIGAGGSIGSRLTKSLLDQGHQVLAVVRSLAGASRIGRYPIRIVQHDVASASISEIQQTFEGCDVVIDCSFSKSTDYNQRVEESALMANKIADAVLRANVKQLIHYGTVSVYPTREERKISSHSIDESTICLPRNDSYADSKLAAEMALLDKACTSQLPVVVLQLPVVYGPFMMWSQAPVTSMSSAQWHIPDDIKGVCSPIHIDDVVSATLLAMNTKNANGQRVLLTGKERLSWMDYYQAYAELDSSLKVNLVSREKVTAQLSLDKKNKQPWVRLKQAFSEDGDFRQLVLAQFGFRHAYKLLKQYRGQQGIDKVKGKLMKLPDQPNQNARYVDAKTLEVLDTMPDINSDKAQRLLGFTAQVSFLEGMEDTRRWLKWARLL